MMKMNLKKRILFAFLSLALILPLVVLGVSADETEYVKWSLTEDGMILSGDKTYHAYAFPAGGPTFYGEAMSFYVYSNQIENEWIKKTAGSEYATATVYAPYPDSEIVFLDIYGEWYLYATPAGKAQMDTFVNGRSINYFLRIRYHESAPLDSSLVTSLEVARAQSGNKRTEEVANLKDAHRFDVIVYDSTYTYAYTLGAIYRLEDGRDYYLHYLSLGNQHFDADGNFSYRSGSVELTLLDEKISTELDETGENITPWSTKYAYEADDAGMILPEAAFWVLYILVVMCPALALVMVGVVMARSKKRGYPKYWYILSLIAALWIFLAILLMILLI